MENQIFEQISNAKLKVLSVKSTHFLFSLLCRLEVKLINHGIAATDGLCILINPKEFLKYTIEQQAFILTHEVLHVALHHVHRKSGRDHRIFNIATDYHINGTLEDLGFQLIPGVYVNQSRFRGLSSEEIYDLIEEEERANPSAPSPMDGDIGNPEDGQDKDSDDDSSGNKASPIDGKELEDQDSDMPQRMTPSEVAEMVDRIVATVAMEAELSQNAGSIPQSIARYLEEMRKPKVDWRSLLLRYLLEVNKTDYSRKKPNRRYLHSPFSMPVLLGESLACVDFVIDVSGSISEKQFSQFLAEVKNVFKTLNPKKINVVQFDSVLCGFDTVRSLQQVNNIKFSGGGGTQPTAAIRKTNETDSKVVVILTDGYFCKKSVIASKKPVIWVVYDNDNFTPPCGKAVKYTLDK